VDEGHWPQPPYMTKGNCEPVSEDRNSQRDWKKFVLGFHIQFKKDLHVSHIEIKGI
jgi:hypothetical protein